MGRNEKENISCLVLLQQFVAPTLSLFNLWDSLSFEVLAGNVGHMFLNAALPEIFPVKTRLFSAVATIVLLLTEVDRRARSYTVYVLTTLVTA